MKKIDKLIIKAFLGPFVLTFLVVVFILLTVQMMNYVDEIFGKDLKWVDLGMLIFHFSVFQTPIAFPLSVMLASLMTFGNLGEHFELTAIKSAGISLVRALMPIYVMVIGVTIFAFYSNNYFVPYSALKAYSLLYDIRQKKPALDIQPGQFYTGIENYKIKVDKKYPDGKSLKGLTIYDHTSHKGNNEVIMADSGQMYTILNDQYLKFELFNGVHYAEGEAPSRRGKRPKVVIRPFTRTYFDRSEMIFDLSSFSMSRTDEGLFASHRMMRNFSQLGDDLDSLQDKVYETEGEIYGIASRYFNYSLLKKQVDIPAHILAVNRKRDSLAALAMERERAREMGEGALQDGITVKPPPTYGVRLHPPAAKVNIPQKKKIAQPARPKAGNKKRAGVNLRSVKRLNPLPKKAQPGMPTDRKKVAGHTIKKEEVAVNLPYLDSSFTQKEAFILTRYEERVNKKANQVRNLKTAVATTRQIKSKLTAQNDRKARLMKEYYQFDIQWQKMLANAIACISMFLIGAPLGAIIKRGGIGFPVIISVVFFIIYYILSIGGEKYAKSGKIPVEAGVWLANGILFPIGLLLLRQAKNDTRLFEADFYKVMASKFTSWLRARNKNRKPVHA